MRKNGFKGDLLTFPLFFHVNYIFSKSPCCFSYCILQKAEIAVVHFQLFENLAHAK